MLKNIKSIYIIGIGGISMSALALMLKERGLKVKGSDLHLSDITERLEQSGIEIIEGDAPQFVLQCDAVLYTGAVGEDNPDLCYAKMLNKKIFTRAEMLGFFSREKKTISIAGTHGKTTTTAMISTILLESGFDPTIHIGGELKCIASNLHLGKGDLFVTEACEYKDAFLSLANYISVVLNIEEDHLDYFKNFDNIQASFNKFIEKTNKNGAIIYNIDACKGKLDEKILNQHKTLSFGLSDMADLKAINIYQYKKGKFSFDVLFRGVNIGSFKLACFGEHNVYNALASIAVSLFLGVDVPQMESGLENFQGVGRRMETIKEDSPFIIHDYAHHPQEIEASLKAIKEVTEERLVCIFQPHTFTRTKSLYNQFLTCFSLCDEVWLLPIYPAREEPITGVTSEALCEDIKRSGVVSRYFSSFEQCREEIENEKYQKFSFAILGAGDIENLAKSLKNKI